jgi:hypothetical protein
MIDLFLAREHLESPWINAMGNVSPCHQCDMPVSLGGLRYHVGDNQPFSSVIEPNRIYWILEKVVTL